MPTAAKPAPKFRPRAHRFALESRQLFDGAALAEVAAGPADAFHDGGDGHGANPAPAEQARPAAAEAATAAVAEPAAPARHVYVIDQGVAHWEQLAAAVPAGGETVLLAPGADGVAQLAAALQGQSGIASLSVFSHASAGALRLGGSTIDAESAARQAAQWQAIGAALDAQADLLLYGCDLARDGTQLLQTLSALTGADVAASTDATGAAAAGGDWVLEAAVGAVEARALAAEGFEGLLAAPTVTTTSATQITVTEPSTLNAGGASSALLSGWTVTDGGNGDVTLGVSLADATLGTLSDGTQSGATLAFTGTAAAATAWLNTVRFGAGDTELGLTARSSTLTVTVSVGTGPTLQTATGTIGVTVTPSNDPVTLADAQTQAVSEVSPLGGTVITAATLAVVDPEVTAGTQLPVQVVYNLTAAPTHGYLTLSGNRLAAGSTFTHQDVLGGLLAYVHTDTSTTQNDADSFTVRLNDGATPLAQSDTATVTLTINPVNQAPAVSGSGSIYEGQPANAVEAAVPQSVVGNFITATGGGDPGDATLTVQITQLPTDGTLYYDGVAVSVGFTFAYADRARLTYANSGSRDPNYPYADGFGVTVTDGGGGTATPASTSATIAITVRGVNDDPVWNAASTRQAQASVAGAVTLTPAMLDASDIDTPDAALTFVVTGLDDLKHGELRLNGGALGVGSTFTLAQLQAGLVDYRQLYLAGAADPTDTFTFQVVDNATSLFWNPDGTSYRRAGGVHDGAGAASPLTTFTFTVSLDQASGSLPPPPVNPSPPAPPPADVTQETTSSSAATVEGGSVVLTGLATVASPGLNYNATGVSAAQVVYTVLSLDGGASAGRWNGFLERWNGSQWVALGAYDTFTQADLDAGNGVTLDAGGNPPGGTPAGVIRYRHDGASEDFQSSVTLVASAGLLQSDGSGGQAVDRWQTTFSFSVTPVNDTPTLGGSGGAVIREGDVAYVTTDRLVVSDPDDAASEAALEGDSTSYAYDNGSLLQLRIASLPVVTATTLASGGRLEYFNGTAWVAATVGQTLAASDLTGDAGTTRLRFVSDGSEERQVTFTAEAVDRWGAVSAPATFTIDLTAVNDPPAIAQLPSDTDPTDPAQPGVQVSANDPLYAREGTFTQISSTMLRAFDPDSTDQQVQYRITAAPAHGSVAYSADGVNFTLLGAGSSFTKADVAAGRVYYVQRGNEPVASTPAGQPDDKFLFTVADGDKEQTSNEFWIYFDPLVNDAPVVTAPSAPVAVDAAAPGLNPVPGFSVADPDLELVSSGLLESDFVQVTVRLLSSGGAPLASAAAYAGVTIVPGAASGATVDASHGGADDYLVLRGTRAQVNAALAGLAVSFDGTHENTRYQLQVVADDRLRDLATGALTDSDGNAVNGTQAAANGGRINQSTAPTTVPSAVPDTAFDAYADAAPAAGASLAGNVTAAAVLLRVSTDNEPAVIAAPAARTTFEDQATFIGGGLDPFTVSDPESAAFGTPVTVTLTVTSGTLGIGGTGAQTTATATATGSQAVTVSGDDSGTLVLTGRAGDIEALLNDATGLGLTYQGTADTNHDLNGAGAGDVTLTVSLDDAGSRIGGDTGSGSAANNPAPVTTALTIQAVNDAPTVAGGTGTVYLQGLTAVPGFSVADKDLGGDGSVAVADGETDYVQVTVRVTTTAGAPLAAADYVTDGIVIDSSATPGASLGVDLNGNNAALRFHGTLADVNAYLAGLRVQLGNALANANTAYRVEVIADDRVRDGAGALIPASGANGGLDPDAAGGVTAVPTADVLPYAAVPAGLAAHVASAVRTVFPTDVNDPARVAVVVPARTEGSATLTLGGITVTDADADPANLLRATLTVPAGFTVLSVGGSGGIISGVGTRVLVLDGTLAQINARLNAVVVALPTAAGVTAANWNGSFDVTVVINDNGHTGARPGSLTGDTNDATINPGDYDYADGSSAALLTTRTFTMVVAPANDAPVVVNGGTQALSTVTEDSDGGSGQSIAMLFGAHFSDAADQLANGGASGVDATGGSASDTFLGVAITSLTPDAAQGAWQYSLDGSTNWTAVGTRDASNALVLGTSAALRFVPAANFHGTPHTLTVRLVEADANNDSASTDPTSGATVDTSTNGDATIYSADTIVLSTSVTNVNDRPTLNNATLVAGIEDQTLSGATVTSRFGSGYADATDNRSGIAGGGNAATTFGGIAVVGNAATAAQGQWEYSTNGGTTWTAVGTGVSDAAALVLPTSAQLRFVPAAHFNGAPGSLTVRGADTVQSFASGVNLGLSATELDNATSTWSLQRTLSTTVAARNDAPVLSGTALNPSVTENTGVGTGVPGVRLLGGSGLSDLDLSTTAALTTTTFGDGSVTVTLAAYQSGDVLYVDGTLPTGITVSGTNTGVGKALTLEFSNGTTLAQVQAVLDLLAWRSTGDNPTNYGAATSRSYTITVSDGNNVQSGGNAGGASALASNALTGTIAITAVNDPPVAVDDTHAVTEAVSPAVAAPISANVITGRSGTGVDSDPDNVVGDLVVSGVRTGAEAGTGTAGTVGTGLTGSHGTLLLNANGSYTYTLDGNDAAVNALKSGQSLQDVFTYTLSDGAGGTDQAQLTITINGATDGAPTVTPVDGNGATTGQAEVFEKGLVDAGDASEATSGSVNVTAPEGLQTLSVGGTVLSLAQLSALAGTPIDIDTGEGTLRLTGFTVTASVGNAGVVPTAGTLAYTYTLKAALAQPGVAESTDTIALVVTDVGSTPATASGTLTVRLVDDTPTAAADTAEIVEDASPATVTGNVFTDVLTGDRLGADTTATPVTGLSFGATAGTLGQPLATAYGSLVMGADGQWTYTLDNAHPAVNALKAGATLTEVVSYEITDADGDAATATLTITIRGTSDGAPSVTPVDGNGAATGQAEVFEKGLVDAGDASEATSGSVNVTAPEGLQTLAVGGTVLSVAQLQALSPLNATVIDTGEGTLRLTGFTVTASVGNAGVVPTAGTLAYTYTLKAALAQAGLTESTDTITLVVTDTGSTPATASGTLTVRLVDDTPTAAADTAEVTEDATPATVAGNVFTDVLTGDRLGADTTATPVTGLSFGATAGTLGQPLATAYGSLVMGADGQWTYTLDNAHPAVNALKAGATLTEVVSYEVTDADGDAATATLTITIRGISDGAPTVTPVDGNGAATGQAEVFEKGLVDAGDASEATSGTVTVSAPEGLQTLSVGGTVLSVAQLQALSPLNATVIDTGEGTLRLTGFTVTASVGNAGVVPTAGTLAYTYTLKAALVQPGVAESTDTIALVVTDAGSTPATAGGTLTVRLVDDTPTAVADTAEVVEDAAPATVAGNVFTNDRLGADTTATPVTGLSFGATAGTLGQALATAYGSLVMSADGQWTYTLDNAHPAVNALKAGATLTEVVSYEITDADGDAATATLTITIRGTSDGAPTVTPVDGNGATTGQAEVFEKGLVDAGDASEATSGSVNVTAPEGLQALAVGGTVLSVAQLQALSPLNATVIDTGEGTLRLTGFTVTASVGNAGVVPTAGTLAYTYTLKAALAQPGVAESTDTIALVVTDAGSTPATAGGTLTVRLVDDTPAAVADTAEIVEDAAPATVAGNVFTNDRLGADTTATPVTGLSFGAATGTLGQALATAYGSLVMGADGQWTYTLDNTHPAVNALKAGGTLTEVVSYEVTDADGDAATATLTLTIRGNTDGVPAVTPLDGNGVSTGQAEVHERGLVDAADPRERSTGSIGVSAEDGLRSLQVGGTTLDLAALGALSPGNATVIDTGEGVLRLTGFTVSATVRGVPTAGTLAYEYTLKAPLDQTGATESTDAIALVVTDAGDIDNTGTLVVRIVDDTPLAADDAAQVTEDATPATLSGDLVANDTVGADATATPVSAVSFNGTPGTVGAPIATAYGTIVVGADGRWTYTLDNANPAVQRLALGETLTERLAYRITDADGDASSAELVVTVRGANDLPTLVIDDGNGAGTGQATVAERGLADPGDDSEGTQGRFVVTAPDGLQGVSVGGTFVSAARLAALAGTPLDIATGRGVITLTGFDAATGAVSWRYVLSAPQAHPAGVETSDDIALGVLDRDGDRVDGTLRVLVLDDAPLARDDAAQLSIALPRATAAGNLLGGAGRGDGDVADRAGADTPVAVNVFSSEGRPGSVGAGALRGQYGTLRVEADGRYVYAVDDAHPAVAALGDGKTLTERFTYTLRDGDGSTSTATLVVTIHGSSAFVKAGDQIFPVAYETVQRDIRQVMETGLFVQHAVRDSAQQSLALAAGVAGMFGPHPGDELLSGSLLANLAMDHAQHVSRDGVGFSLRLEREVRQLLAQRLEQSELIEPVLPVPPGAPAGPGNADVAPASDEAAAARPAPERIVVPRLEAAAGAGSPGDAAMPAAPARAAAPGFSRLLAAQADAHAGAAGFAGGPATASAATRIKVPQARG